MLERCHEEPPERRDRNFSFHSGSPGEGIEHLTETTGIGNQEIVPDTVLTESVHGIHPALCRFRLGIRAVRHLSLDLDNQILLGSRDDEEIRDVPSK